MKIDIHKMQASLLRKNGWILSGPGDLFSLRDNIFAFTISGVNSIFDINYLGTRSHFFGPRNVNASEPEYVV